MYSFAMPVEEIALSAAAKAASRVIERASPIAFEKIAKRLKIEALRARVQFTKTFQDHLQKSFERSLKIKTVISKDKPVLLEEIYVPLTLRSDEKEGILDVAADPTRTEGARFVLSGTGGAGKTVLMKHLLNISAENQINAVPLFVELRNLEFDSADSLEELIFHELMLDGGQETFEFFKVATEEGLFVLYLDGFDEIHPDESHKAISLIKRFASNFPNVSMLITTRPKTGIVTVREFVVFHVEPLSKQSAMSLIEKTEFDQITKERFLEQMRSGLFEKHRTLMSLPILVAMMLLAFRTYADIPDRMTVFYSQAFETLYSIHDAENKELFKRQHHAGLAPDVFRSVLQTFCYLSLSNHDIEFTESTLNSYIQRALRISKVDATVEKYKNDLIHNVCVLQPDGLSYVFVHRSFQEYFASLFALNYSGEQRFEVIDKIVDVSESAVAGMMIEINEIKTKRYWLFPRLSKFRKYLQGVKRRKLSKQITAFYSQIWVDSDDQMSFSLGREATDNHRLMELFSSCLARRLAYAHVTRNLQLHDEKLFSALQPIPLNLKRQRSAQQGVIFGNERLYLFKDGAEEIVADNGFSHNFVRLLETVDNIHSELKNELSEHKQIEDSELFN